MFSLRTACLASLTAMLLLSGCSENVEKPKETLPQASPAKPNISPEPKIEIPEEAKGKATIAFVGDIMFESKLAQLVGKNNALGEIESELKKPDLLMGNLETSLTDSNVKDGKGLETPDNRYHFKAPEASVKTLENAGFDILTMANNHAGDYGLQGVKDSLKVRDNANLGIVGIGKNRKDAFTPYRTSVKNNSFAFFGADDSFLESKAPHWQAGENNAGLASARGESRSYFLEQVRLEASKTDIVVVYMHWGPEYAVCPDGKQQRLAQDLSRAGADIIVGSHAHRLQGSGYLNNTYVAYGLGNFLWYHDAEPSSGILEITVKDGRVIDDGWKPVLIRPNAVPPVVADGQQGRSVLAMLDKLALCSNLTKRPSEVNNESFQSKITAVDDKLLKRINSSYRKGCPLAVDELSYVSVSYVDFKGQSKLGELIVNKTEAKNIVKVFRKLYEARFPIKTMQLVSDFNSDDAKSMAANNTSAFNCRNVAGTNRWSEHSYGKAIDLNPVQNPYVRDNIIDPISGRKYAFLDRSKNGLPKGVIGNNSIVVKAFASVGWTWGNSFKDYQHFSASGG